MKSTFKNFVFSLLIPFTITFACSTNKKTDSQFTIEINVTDSTYPENISGKFILLLDSDTSQSLIYGVNPYKSHPVFTYNVHNKKSGNPIKFRSPTASWPDVNPLLEGIYAARVIFDFDTIKRSSFVAKGNGYSNKQILDFSSNQKQNLSFEISKHFKGWEFQHVPGIEEIRMKSKHLSKFWNQDVFIEAAVVLPQSYKKDTNRKYSIVFVFPGFGSNHAAVTYGDGQMKRYGMNTVGNEKIFVFCNAEFRNGYHHFVDSKNNGPWQSAFTEEFIPYIEKKFRAFQSPEKRFLMGQSSGAWTAAYMLVKHPELFAGAFAASPDPVDFRTMGFNIYRNNANFYHPDNPDSMQIKTGEKSRQYAILEDVIGESGQIRSWEATFSPAQNGIPARLFNRETGIINYEIAEYWKQFDISLQLNSKPEFYKKALKDKLYFFVSEDDPYHLEEGIHKLEEVCKKQNIQVNFCYYHNLGHNVWTDETKKIIHSIMDQKSYD